MQLFQSISHFLLDSCHKLLIWNFNPQQNKNNCVYCCWSWNEGPNCFTWYLLNSNRSISSYCALYFYIFYLLNGFLHLERSSKSYVSNGMFVSMCKWFRKCNAIISGKWKTYEVEMIDNKFVSTRKFTTIMCPFVL